MNLIGESPYEPVQKPWDDIKEITCHEQVYDNGIQQQSVSLQRTYLQQIRGLRHRTSAQAFISVSEQLHRPGAQIRYAQQIGSDPVTVELEERIQCHDETEVHHQDQVTQNIVACQEE